MYLCSNNNLNLTLNFKAMTPNRSLELSLTLQNLIHTDLLYPIQSVFPYELIRSYSENERNPRDRIYNTENTVLAMVLTALQEDKTLQNSVNIFKQVFDDNNKKAKAIAEKIVQEEKENDLRLPAKKRGRPKLYNAQIPKSKTMDISSNTAAYSKARKRLAINLLDNIFESSKDFSKIALNSSWNEKEVFITDGTYFQMQDTPELRKKYDVKSKSKKFCSSYPQGLLEGIVHQGSGCIWDYSIGTRHQSELELVGKMINKLPKGSLLLADDLYNTYAIFSIILGNGLDIIVPGKRIKNYTIIEKIAEGDEIVEIQKTSHPGWLTKEFELPAKIQLRRIVYRDSYNNKEYILYTTILANTISKADIITKYATRWDIEITIREVKTIMDINVARSKTEEMVFKEFRVAIIAYNMIRKIIAQSTENVDFSPKKDIIQEFFKNNKNLFIDKKGRIYNRWSPGRYGKIA